MVEADFNWWNKLIFTRRMMKLAGENNAIPEELFAKKDNYFMDAVMSKTFVADVSKVQHHLCSIGGCNLGNRYDCGAHPPTSIDMQA